MGYADFTFYTTEFLLGRIPNIAEVDFPFFSRNASLQMDAFTLGNTKNATVVTDEMKMCCCEIAEHLFFEEKSGRDLNIKSENNDGYSVVFDTERTTKVVVEEITRKHLSGTGLLYKGGVLSCRRMQV